MKILGIETSCDETAAAVYDSKEGLLSNVVASQIDIHKKTGGVVPEVASRAHVEQIIPVINESLKLAKTSLEKIDYIAVTHAPGLIGSLLVGVNTAKTLSMILDKPLLPINHLEGHIYANFIRENENEKLKMKNCGVASRQLFKFPAVILLVSGGHTSLILMKGHGKYKTLGETLDDAAGEAFDKVAKILGLEYPGGPNVSRMAEEYRRKYPMTKSQCPINDQIQNPKNLHASRDQAKPDKNPKFMFPRSMLNSGDFNFSFSGLKTAVLYAWQRENGGRTLRRSEATGKGPTSVEARKQMFTYEFEEAVVDILATKTISAAKKYKAKTVSICGGVAANKRLREEIGDRVKKLLPTTLLNLPPIQYCGDNAAMIACVASYRIKKIKKEEIKKLKNLDFEVESNKNL